jgi:DNA polymerase-1
MKALINYSASERNYLPMLDYYLKKAGVTSQIKIEGSKIIENIAELALVKDCDVVLLLDEGTLQHVHKGATLSKWRGSRINTYDVPVLVLAPLNQLVSMAEGKYVLEQDLLKLQRINHTPSPFTFSVVDTPEEFAIWLERLGQAEALAFDLETRTITDENDERFTYISCYAYTVIERTEVDGVYNLATICVPLEDFAGCHYLDWRGYEAAIQFLRDTAALPVPKIMHNGKYDCFHSIRYRAFHREFLLDTMGLMHARYSELPKSLDYVASLYIPDYCYWKHLADSMAKARDDLGYYTYNASDTWYTARIALHYLTGGFTRYAIKNYAMTFPLVYPFLYSDFEGIKIDNSIRARLKKEAEDKAATALIDLRKMTDDPEFNPSSSKQVGEFLYDRLGASDPRIAFKKDAAGVRRKVDRATDKKSMEELANQHPILHMFVGSLGKYRTSTKAISTYFDFDQLKGRLLYSIDPFGTETGRSSCRSSAAWVGTQVQNIPPYAKGMLVADEGYTLFEIDNSQSEARCVGYLAKEYNLTKALEDPEKDFYTSLGTSLFGLPYEDVSKEFRNAVLKKIVHGTNYLMGENTFVTNATVDNVLFAAYTLNRDVPFERKAINSFAGELLASYHRPFPNIKKWYEEVKREINTTRMLTSPMGYTRVFFGDVLKDHNVLRGAVAHAPQNLSVMVLNKGVMKLWRLIVGEAKLGKCDIRFKAQIHDSIFGQVRDDQIHRLEELQELVTTPIQVHGRTMLIPTEVKKGKQWNAT